MPRVPVLETGPLALAAVLVVLSMPHDPRAAAAHEGPMWRGLRPVVWTPARLSAEPLATASVRIARDPETGALTAPDAAQSRALARAPGREVEPLQVVAMPDGSLMIDLEERFMWDFAVVRGADGRLRAACAGDARALGRAARTPLAAPEE